IGSLSSSVKSSVHNLGVILDSSLSLDAHVRQLTCSSFFHLRNIAKLRAVVSKTELEMVIHAFIPSHLDYCNSLFTCLSKTCLNRLQTVQNAAARLLTKANRRSHITPILSGLHWFPINFRVQFKILVLTFRALYGQAPLLPHGSHTDILRLLVTQVFRSEATGHPSYPFKDLWRSCFPGCGA
ncbi:hypothetical protein LDENG_00093850, partial [Lucifuga dentata]